MSKYALLCGSAPDGKIQKKIDSMYDSLLSENGGRYEENEIMIFPNGIDEASLVYVMNSLRMGGIEQVLLYICTVTPVENSERTVWLGGNEIRKVIFEKPAKLAEFVLKNTPSSEIRKHSVQVVYDSDREFVDGSEYYFDEEIANLAEVDDEKATI